MCHALTSSKGEDVEVTLLGEVVEEEEQDFLGTGQSYSLPTRETGQPVIQGVQTNDNNASVQSTSRDSYNSK